MNGKGEMKERNNKTMNNSSNNNKRTATLKAIMRMTFMTLLLMPLGGWKNNDNGEGNVQQQQQGINKGDKTFPTKEDIKRGFYIHSPNATAWKPNPMTAWNINNTWLKLLVINALCNNNAQAMQHYMHDGTTMTWDTDTTNTKTRKQQQRKGTTTMEEEMAYITSIIVALFIITIAAINLQANKQLKERKKRTINRKEKEL